jgi:predicted AAA+ superfamily ATPase
MWGGYPPVWQRTGDAERLRWLRDYRKTFLERDVADVGQVANNDTFALAQKLLCSRTANLLSISEVARDLGVAVNTLKRYLELLTLTFQCYLLPPWRENVGKRLTKSPKLYFPDAGLNRAILGELAIDRGAAYETFMTEHGGKTHIGLVIYPGDEMVELRKNVWGIPDWYLLGAF